MAETIRVVCPGCKAKINAPSFFAGKQSECPKCKTLISIPKKVEPPKEEAEEFAFATAPELPPSPPPVPIFERDEVDEEDDEDEDFKPVARKQSATILSDRFPNLTANLVLIQLGVRLVAAAAVLVGFLFWISAPFALSRYDIFTRLGMGTVMFASSCLSAWLTYTIVMAFVELFRVFIQIEANTRPKAME